MSKPINKSHKRKGLTMLLIILGIILLFEAVALTWLYLSVGRYEQFWDNKAEESGEITYLALGDSTAQGIGATNPMKGYVGLVAKDIEVRTGKSVRIINLSTTGAKMKDYLRNQAPTIPKINADIVTIEIGANDIRNFDAQDYRENFKKVLATLPDDSYVANMPYFNSRPGSTQNGKDASKIIEEEIANYPDLVRVDLQAMTEQNQSIFGFAPDLFHPNNLMYKYWAKAFLKEINT